MNSILIVDDDVGVQKLFSVFLKGKGYHVETAGNGIEGLSKLQENKIDLVLVDIMMPEMDGLEVVQAIRKEDKVLPIIAVSGGMRDVEINFVSCARDFGANAIFEKPLVLAELLKSVKALLPEAV